MVTLLQGDCLEMLKTLPAESVQCMVTSPPYYGLRDYGMSGQIGLEQTPEEYVTNLVNIFREVWRVLRTDGTVWLNLGDSYAGSGKGGQSEEKRSENWQPVYANHGHNYGMKPKDLLGIPWRVAFALQAEGWWLRSDIIWNKTNVMPESVTDRPTKAHEYIFLLTKSQKYFYDADAVREELAESTKADKRNSTGRHTQGKNYSKYYDEISPDHTKADKPSWYRSKTFVNSDIGRNRRSVWTIPTSPYKGAHFATFPTALVSPCILAGTSAKGCCPECGKPWKRQKEKTGKIQRRWSTNNAEGSPYQKQDSFQNTYQQIGWSPDCTCHGHFETIKVQESYTAKATGTHDTKRIYIPDNDQPEPVPCVVLDPFMGSGTTLLVATQYGRDGIGIELNPEYIELAKKRLDQVQTEMTL